MCQRHNIITSEAEAHQSPPAVISDAEPVHKHV